MQVSPVSGIAAYRPVHPVQPVKRDDKPDTPPPVKDKETRPPEHHQRAKPKHKVDIKA
jgi:hypothetical protein